MACNWIMVILPGLYGWKVHGFWIGLAVFAGCLAASTAADRALMTRDFEQPERWVLWARVIVMGLGYGAVAWGVHEGM